MKKRFTEEPVLMMPDQTKSFQIECDASKWASGAVLTQLDINGEVRGLCYGVKRGAARRYGTSQNPQTPTPNLTPTKNN
jgi:hypothetical protein